MRTLGIRATADLRNEKIGFKIREAQLEKTPYMLIIGDREAAEDKVSVRGRKLGDLGTMSFDDFVSRINNEIKTFSSEN